MPYRRIGSHFLPLCDGFSLFLHFQKQEKIYGAYIGISRKESAGSMGSDTQDRCYEYLEVCRAEINLVGSLNMGLLVKNRDVDFHIYSSPLTPAGSFMAMAKLAENPFVKRITYNNLLDTEEACIEWHVWYEDPENGAWKMDMIHILKHSRYDGYFEKMAERIKAVLTEETRKAILRLKYETPDTEYCMGVEYYQAVLRDGVRTYAEFENWRRQHPVTGIVEWMP